MRNVHVAIPLILLTCQTPFWTAQAHDATAQSDSCAGEDRVVGDVLDPTLDTTRKSAPIAAMKAQADSGCADASQVLGNLYRFGSALPGNPLRVDLSLAAKLLEQAGLGGETSAFRDLAELHLASNSPQDAMLPTQVYLWLQAHESTHPNQEQPKVTGYDADLLLRAQDAWHRSAQDDNAIQPVLSAYIGRHGPDMLAARDRLRELVAHRPSMSLATRPQINPKKFPNKSGYALLRVEALPSGAISRVAIESYGPTPDIAKQLLPIFAKATVVPFAGEEPRSGKLPVVIAASH